MTEKLISLISTDTFGSCHGIRSISVYLKTHGYTTSIYFMRTPRRFYSKHILNDLRVRVSNSNLIGISCLSQNAEKANQVIEFLKPLGIPIVWGGIHATLNPERCLEYADIVCIGEGEGAILDLAESLDDKDKIKTIKNIWVKENGFIYKNELRPLISNLDELPLEDYELDKQFVLVQSKYINKIIQPGLVFTQYRYLLNKSDRRGFSVMMSRGCPFSCFYCYNYDLHKLYGEDNPKVRRKSVEAAISELVYRKQTIANFNFFVFDDDEFLGRPLEEIKRFSAAYKEKVNLPFACYFHFSNFIEEKLKTLVDCGLRMITIGIQSGSSRINTQIYKRIMPDRQQCIEIAEQINRYRGKILPPFYQIIIANPYENEEDVSESIRLVRSLPKPFLLRVFHLAFFPGSAMAKKALSDGIIKSEKEFCYKNDFFDAFSHFGIRRKNKPLYHWFLLELLTGRHTRKRAGLISERTFNILSNKRIVSFFSKFRFAMYLLRYLLVFKFMFEPYLRSYILSLFFKSDVKLDNFGKSDEEQKYKTHLRK